MSQGYNMILSNKGIVDSYMHRDPTDTQFSEVLMQHTLSIEWVKEIIGTENGGTLGIASNNIQSYTSFNLHDTGDVLSDVFLQTVIPALQAQGTADHMHLVNAAGYACINNIELKMGNLQYDYQDSVLMYVLEELTTNPAERLVEETGNYKDEAALIRAAKGQQVFQVRIPLWFTEDVSQGLKICALGNNALALNVHWEEFQYWIVNRGSDVWDSSLISNVKTQLSQASTKLLGRFHFMEEQERSFYTTTPIMSLFTFYQNDTRQLASSTTQDQNRLQFNFPTTAFIFLVRNSSAFDGQYYQGKVGTKDKFWFGTPTGVEPLTGIDVKINNSSLLAGYGLNSMFMRTFAAKHGFGYRPSQPVYVLPFQKRANKRDNLSYMNCSRFDNIVTTAKLGYTASSTTNTVYTYGVSRNVFTVDTGFANNPLAA